MNRALIYRPNNRKLIAMSFICAIGIHLSAIAIAGNKSKPVSLTWAGELDGPPVIAFDPQPPPPEEVAPPEQILPPPDEDVFPLENLRQTPIKPRTRTPVTTIRSENVGAGRTTNAGSVRALTLYAPKPNYPYEARRSGITGSGIAQLAVNSASGAVIDARMVQSTGNTLLDNTTIEALRRWRFKPGAAMNVNVPITYTLTGVSY